MSRSTQPRGGQVPQDGVVDRRGDLVARGLDAGTPARLPISSSISRDGQDLALDQGLGQAFEFVAVLFEEAVGALVGLAEDRRDFLVDDLRGVLGVVAGLAHLAAQERVLLGGAEEDRADALAHAPLGDHHPGQPGGLLQVARGAGGQVVEDEPLGGAAAQRHGQVGLDLALVDPDPVLLGEELGDAQRPAAGDDRHLVDRVGGRGQPGDQGVADLVVGGQPLVLLGDDLLALRPHDDLVARGVEVAHVDLVLVLAGGQQRGLVDEVGQVGAAHPDGPPGDAVEVDVGVERDVAGVDLEDLEPALLGRAVDGDVAVEPAGAQQGGVEHVGAVGRGQDDDALVGREAVHLGQDLVERLLALVVAAAEARARTRPTASISSMNRMQGLFSLAVLNMSRTRLAPTPTNIWMNSEPEIE